LQDLVSLDAGDYDEIGLSQKEREELWLVANVSPGCLLQTFAPGALGPASPLRRAWILRRLPS